MRVIAARFFCLIGGLLLLAGFTAGAITLDANPGTFNIGDKVHISGHVGIPNTIAVYFFVTGPGLDRAGTTRENLNLKAGAGYFTSAFVHPDGTFAYEWDTAFTVGPLLPGTYRIYVVDVPLNLDRLTDREEISISSINVTFLKHHSTDVSMGWGVPFAAVLFSMGLLLMKKKIT